MITKIVLVATIDVPDKDDGLSSDQAKFEEGVDEHRFVFFFCIDLVLSQLRWRG